jgi:hypothetical protein
VICGSGIGIVDNKDSEVDDSSGVESGRTGNRSGKEGTNASEIRLLFIVFMVKILLATGKKIATLTCHWRFCYYKSTQWDK